MSSKWVFQKSACVRCTFMHPVIKICYFGYPVCPKTIFQGSRLVRRLFFMPSVHIKSIFNDLWWFAVDYLWTQDLVQQVFIVFCVITKNTSSNPGHSYKITFGISGQSPNSAIHVSAIMGRHSPNHGRFFSHWYHEQISPCQTQVYVFHQMANF